ncbi:probable LRR receptor-like serine/threonine-protein kinase At2g16250 [Rhodamnia argentea]|uniref:non-specific serine/threonine protein kinase n=1 Tax=Rhodamnia argentea TaxID=178133 RepID=A0ABM3GX22_9MYRT|nr:probable LRR receptor-like serine/threonine-protein kinase At2g16250 [Rhodamnia argentea]
MKKHRSEVPLFLLLLVLLFSELTIQQQQPLSSRTERVALLQLRSSLGIRSREWPRKADPCSLWQGVKCENGRVTEINISGFRRTRVGSQNPQFSVDALANFTLLTSFNASRFSLPGQIPDWFGQQLGSLQVLDLRSCGIIGIVPPSVGNLTNLTSLYLADNILNGTIPLSLGELSHLSVLDLSSNALDGSIPSSLTSLKNLSTLDISSNSLSGSIPLGFGNLSGLRHLNLSGNELSGSLPVQLGDLGNLVDLDLSFNNISGSVPSDLRGLRSLQRMLLGNNLLGGPLRDDLFSNPSQLQVVVLRHNSFNGSLPRLLWSMPGLALLDISSNNFTGVLPDTGSNSTAAVLNISQNLFYGNLTQLLVGFGFIDLSKNYFEGKVPDFAITKSSLGNNCLQNVSDQRTAVECASFYAERGLVFDNFGLPNGNPPSPAPASAPETKKKSKRKLIILVGVLGGLGLVALLFVLLALLLFCTRKRGSANQIAIGVGPASTGGTPLPSGASVDFSNIGDAYTYQQLLLATNEFNDSNLIKHGHSGDLFRGILDGGIPVVIKKVDLCSIKKEVHLVELDFFGKVSHGRFVPFLGHFLERENEKFLVYKYMPNEDLASSLFRKTSSEDDSLQSLDWIKRLKVAVGAAEGLSYLHHECTPPLVHRDVQASSILLDDKYEVRLGSLSEVCAQEGDTHHSRFSRLLRLQQSLEQGTSDSSTANCAYDVYCFGKVLLELVTGKLGLSASSDTETKEWLEQTLPYINIYDKELVTKIVDPLLIVDEDLLEEVWAMAIVARSCLNPKPSRRPPMRYVVKALENPLKIVREENYGSGRLRTTSSRGSWNATLFGSWRHSSSDVAVIPTSSAAKAEGTSSFKQSGTTGSQGSNHNGSSSRRRHSKDIFPEPSDVQDVERQDQE